MRLEHIKQLIEEMAQLSAQRKIIENIIEEKRQLIIAGTREHPDMLIPTECTVCGGTGEGEYGACLSCDDGTRYVIIVPSSPDDLFTCKIYDVSQRHADQKKARELLHHNTFHAIFQVSTSTRVDIRPTAAGRATIGK